MRQTQQSPFTHGMEIEQFTADVPDHVNRHVFENDRGSLRGWHNDASGPRETAIGPYKNAKTILNRFFAGTRDEGYTWEWHAAESGRRQRGAGSHLHLCVADEVFDDTIAAWTIAYNTVVELTPFFAPFFCHNWQDGFRNGSTHRDELAGRYWANPQTRRFSQETMRSYVDAPHRHSRSYSAVTTNGASRNGKPLTIELRQNDAHPSIALAGLTLLRRVTGVAIERGESPKLRNHNETLERVYTQIYERAAEIGLIAAMKEPIPDGIHFVAGRGLPDPRDRTDAETLEHFDSVWDVLERILILNGVQPGNWLSRVRKLVKSGSDDHSPHMNDASLWDIDAPRGEFGWQNGPDVE